MKLSNLLLCSTTLLLLATGLLIPGDFVECRRFTDGTTNLNIICDGTTYSYSPEINTISPQTPPGNVIDPPVIPPVVPPTPVDPPVVPPTPVDPPVTPGGKVIEKLNANEVTHFDDDQYQCWEWNNRAKSAIKQGVYFAATNHQLVNPNKAEPYKLNCGGSDYMCARSPVGVEYVIIDWCDPNNQCSQSNRNHIDILVRTEDPSGQTCTVGCESYDEFKSSTNDIKEWELVECSRSYNPLDYAFEQGTQSGTNFERIA